jgi:ribosomal protein L3 glutamine methyltransferase
MNSTLSVATLQDAIAMGARRMLSAGVCIGHDADNAIDEARALVMHALHLPPDLPAHFAEAALLPSELCRIETLFERRISERIPAAYLIGSVRFGDLTLKVDARALVPRSPLLELIPDAFGGLPRPARIERVLELCTGGGCLALAMAVAHPQWQIDAVDLSPDALALAAENRAALGLQDRVDLLQSDLYQALADRSYDLIIANPPYLSQAEFDALPAEYAHEPALALPSGADGLDLTLRILHQAPGHLRSDGLLIVEIGQAERALRRLLPQLPLLWVEFSVGGMGVFAIDRAALVGHLDAIGAALTARRPTPESRGP